MLSVNVLPVIFLNEIHPSIFPLSKNWAILYIIVNTTKEQIIFQYIAILTDMIY